ncbi:MAG: acetate/propionate family kinase [Vicinamibacteria bacterium]
MTLQTDNEIDENEAEAGRVVLALNSGSSSLKFGLYRVSESACRALVTGQADLSGGTNSAFEARDSQGLSIVSETTEPFDSDNVVAHIGKLIQTLELPPPEGVGHRIVHGGPHLHRHGLIDPSVETLMKEGAVFAPVHTPAAMALLRAAQEHFVGVPNAACFDTAFHDGLPDLARLLPLPKEWAAEGLRRYGFHGVSCESIVRQLGAELPSRVVIAHLGHGASLTAVRDGRSIDTTMGLTPSGGVMMGTRTGDLDPGVLLYLMSAKSLDAAALDDLINHQSGLLGVSGLSGDVRVLDRAAPQNPEARLALEMFGYSVSKHLAAMMSALGGADLIVFTGGIGENDSDSRARICERLAFAGVVLDDSANRVGTGRISSAESRCEVRVVPSQENEEIARRVAALLPMSPGR